MKRSVSSAAAVALALAALQCTTLVGIDKDYKAAPSDAGQADTAPQPSGQLRVTAASTRLVLHQGETKDVSVEIARGADPGAVSVVMNNLPPNVSASPLVIVPGETRGAIRITAATTAPIGPVEVTIVASVGAEAATAPLSLVMLGPPGALDPSLGTGGIASVSLGGRFAAVARTAQGRIVVGGATATELVAAALTANGSVDGPYGSGGLATLAVGTNVQPGGGALASGDAFIVGGTATVDGGAKAVVTRVTPTGSVDTAYGTGGANVFGLGADATGINALVAGPGETTVVAGYVVQAGQRVVAVGRYTQTGVLDPSFAGGSFKTVDLVGSGEEARGLAVQPDGKIVVVGQTSLSAPGTSDFLVMRFMSNGDPDMSFGTAGSTTVDFGAFEDGARAVAVQPDGSIVVVGMSKSPSAGTSSDVAIVRLLANGNVDPAFGKRTYPIGPIDDVGTAVAIQADGQIVVLAETNSSNGIKNVDFALLRCRTDGALDTTFGNGGKVVTDFGGPSDFPRALFLVGDTQILVAGHNDTGAALVARYWQ